MWRMLYALKNAGIVFCLSFHALVEGYNCATVRHRHVCEIVRYLQRWKYATWRKGRDLQRRNAYKEHSMLPSARGGLFLSDALKASCDLHVFSEKSYLERKIMFFPSLPSLVRIIIIYSFPDVWHSQKSKWEKAESIHKIGIFFLKSEFHYFWPENNFNCY